jgi:uncharacterized DUF497 family protein
LGMVRFEWDETKAQSNARMHGVRFEDAMLGDLNPKRRNGPDPPHRDNPRHDGIAQSQRASRSVKLIPPT